MLCGSKIDVKKIINEKLFTMARKCSHRFGVARKRYISQINSGKNQILFFLCISVYILHWQERKTEWEKERDELKRGVSE